MLIRPKTNFWWDFILFINLVALGFTGMVVHYALPAGSGSSLSLLWMTRHQWGDIHFWAAIVMLGQILFHFILHWKWIRAQLGKHGGGSGFLWGWVVLLAGALIIISPMWMEGLRVETGLRDQGNAHHRGAQKSAVGTAGRGTGAITEKTQDPVVQPYNQDHIPGASPEDEYRVDDIRGSWTLSDVEERLGVSASVLKHRLGLLPELPDSATLRYIKTEYKVTMSQMRAVIAEEQGLIP